MIRHLLSCLLPLSLALPVSAQAEPVTAPPATAAPVTVDLSAQPWVALGRVQTEFGTRCSGFLIAPSLVMTAAHCLFRQDTGHYVQPGSVHFLWRYDRGRYAAHAWATSFVITPGYDPFHEHATIGLDRAFLTLDRPIGDASQTLHVGPVSPGPGSTLYIGGYALRYDEIPLAGRCQVLGFLNDGGGHRLIVDNCRGELGTSGAPLLTQAADGSWTVVGMVVGTMGPGHALGLAEPLAR